MKWVCVIVQEASEVGVREPDWTQPTWLESHDEPCEPDGGVQVGPVATQEYVGNAGAALVAMHAKSLPPFAP